MKKVLIISTSLRNGANSEILAHEAEKGAKEKGHSVDFISLKGKEIKYCVGCMACQKIGHCVIKDDANAITEKIKNSEVIIWVTPVYYYEMAGQMKTLIDRANSLFVADYKFKEVYVITTSGEQDNDGTIIKRVLAGVQGWIDCFKNIKLCGWVSGGGLNNPNEAKNNEKILKQAYELGKKI